MANFLQQVSTAMADTIGDVRRAVVQILGPEGSIGAGTIWHSDGLILTNAHVVVDHRTGIQRELSVELPDGEQFPAQLLAYDLSRDLAALAIEADNLPTITVGSARTLTPGDWVMALGHPFGIIDSLTAGMVIGTGRNLPEQAGRDWIALSLKLRPGHSGGPLVNTVGELVGINTMIAGPDVGFAIPVHVVKDFLRETLGKSVEPLTQDDAPVDVLVL